MMTVHEAYLGLLESAFAFRIIDSIELFVGCSLAFPPPPEVVAVVAAFFFLPAILR